MLGSVDLPDIIENFGWDGKEKDCGPGRVPRYLERHRIPEHRAVHNIG